MDIDDETPETGSDELLSDDNLRLPESANILVRLHAVRAWLARRQHEASIAIGAAALDLQEAMLHAPQGSMLRRRERMEQEEKLRRIQQRLTEEQQRLRAFEEAQSLLEDCVAHTSGERVLVEYYLTLEDLVQSNTPPDLTDEHELHRTPTRGASSSPGSAVPTYQAALAAVQHRVERVGAPNEEE